MKQTQSTTLSSTVGLWSRFWVMLSADDAFTYLAPNYGKKDC